MSAVAVRCPHCGAFQPRSPVKGATAATAAPIARPAPAPPPVAPLKVSPEEARALLQVKDVGAGHDVESPLDEPGVFAGLLLPHPRSSGGTRAAEIVLTALAAPLVALALVSLGSLYLRASRFGGVRARPAAFRVGGMVLGAAALGCFLFAGGFETPAVIAIVASQLGFLAARAGIRAAAKRRRERAYDLTR
jgi:hypothetical protein